MKQNFGAIGGDVFLQDNSVGSARHGCTCQDANGMTVGHL